MASDDQREPPSPARAEEPPVPGSLELASVGYRRVPRVPLYYAEPVLPSPRVLAGYRAAGRDAPGAILAHFLTEGAHRRRIELAMVYDEQQRLRRGQWFALVIMLTGMLVSARLVQAGHDWAGTVLAGGNLVAMGALFLRAGRGRTGGVTGGHEKMNND
ncbi:MAG TPA: hypothetical protein VFJ82_08705 [Longimicrobium sp.]|nr:hypothetical protein [Longimicrobium sp.]